MRKLLISVLVLTGCIYSNAQTDTIRSFSDLPALNFETAALKTNDAVATSNWFKHFAAVEEPHVDSILSHAVILDSADTWSWLTRLKAMCQYINGDWSNLVHADTVFRNMQQAYIVFRKVGIAELSSFAKAKLQPGKNFSDAYLDCFRKSTDTLNNSDREMFIGYTLGQMRSAKAMYEKRLAKIIEGPVIADTLLGAFTRGYIYDQLKQVAYTKLNADVNNLVKASFTRADTLRGSITPGRAWWDVLYYNITIKPDYNAKALTGNTVIRYKVINDNQPGFMQIDLQEPLVIDKIIYNKTNSLSFKRDGNTWHVTVPKQKKLSVDSVDVYYHGQVHIAVNAPWDGGWVFSKDSLNNPWMSVACEGFGASVWFPCKDHLSDEPDNGASVSLIVPDSLAGVSNGRLQSTQKNNDGTTTYTWSVVNPINSYDITAYIGKYVNFNEVYDGLKGKLDLGYWVLNFNLQRAKDHMVPNVHRMMEAFEYWMGPYPFYEDGYKLVESPYAGMEHQSAIADGNLYMNGYWGSGDSIAMRSDYMIVHESGHEWFGNNISAKDLADMWIHEGFTAYSETLFNEYYYGKEQGNIYTNDERQGIENAFPVIGYYHVNDQIDMRNQDIYSKGSNLLQSIRHSMNNDSLFRKILIGLNKTFYHQTVTTAQIENYISHQSGFDYSKVFDQYLRAVDIPQLEFYFSKDHAKVFYRYTNCIRGFNLPLVLQNKSAMVKIIPNGAWQSVSLSKAQQNLFNKDDIENMYYINANVAQAGSQ